MGAKTVNIIGGGLILAFETALALAQNIKDSGLSLEVSLSQYNEQISKSLHHKWQASERHREGIEMILKNYHYLDGADIINVLGGLMPNESLLLIRILKNLLIDGNFKT